MGQRNGRKRQHRSPPVIRRPRVPGGERLVRQHGWLTSDHPQARWYRVLDHSADWSHVRFAVVRSPGAEETEVVVVVRPDGYVLPQRPTIDLGAEAIRVIATAIRAAQRAGE